MAHPLHHAQSSARRYGGCAEDYQHIHDWFDGSKAHFALPQHRALRHHTAGIFDAETLFGATLTNSAGRVIPTRWIGEQHVREDCRCIPSMADWFGAIEMQPWMGNGVLLDEESTDCVDQRAAWASAVANGQTIMGLSDWITERMARHRTSISAGIGDR